MIIIQHSHPSYRLGTHVSLQDTVHSTILFALQNGMTALQVFLGSPQSFARRQVSADDADKCRHWIYRFNAYFFSHAPYVYNLANESNGKVSQILASLKSEMTTVKRLGGHGVVLHPGSCSDRAHGMSTIAQALSRIHFEEGEALLLENMAGQGNVLGDTLQELMNIFNQLDQKCQPFVYFCIDTAHLWGRGEYSINTLDGVHAFWKTADELILNNNERFSHKIRLIHLNDSAVKFGSHVDRHALINEGEIWPNDESLGALKEWMDESARRGIPMVMETDPSDIEKFLW